MKVEISYYDTNYVYHEEAWDYPEPDKASSMDGHSIVEPQFAAPPLAIVSTQVTQEGGHRPSYTSIAIRNMLFHLQFDYPPRAYGEIIKVKYATAKGEIGVDRVLVVAAKKEVGPRGALWTNAVMPGSSLNPDFDFPYVLRMYWRDHIAVFDDKRWSVEKGERPNVHILAAEIRQMDPDFSSPTSSLFDSAAPTPGIRLFDSAAPTPGILREFIRNAVNLAQDEFNAILKDSFAAHPPAQGLGMVKIAEGSTALISDPGAPYSLCQTTIGELRRYFAEVYPFPTLFNMQVADGREKKDTIDLVARVAAETNFVVLHAEGLEEKEGWLDIKDAQLLDGFMRVLWAGNPDDEVFVKVYQGLSPVQVFRLMIMVNLWKIKADGIRFLLDRGFAIYIWRNTGLFIDQKLAQLAMEYVGEGSGSKDHVYKQLWDCQTFLDDIRFLAHLNHCSGPDGRSLPLLLQLGVARFLGSIRKANLDFVAPLDTKRFDELIAQEEKWLAKLRAMSVPERIRTRIQEDFKPKFVEYAKNNHKNN